MKKNKSIYIKLLESFILVMIFTTTILSNTICQSVFLQERLNNQDTEKGFIKLHDNYDGIHNRMSIKEFFKKPDAIEKMRKLYININNNNDLKYYEVLIQNLEFLGNYTGNSALVNGSKESINQKINGNFITSLKSLQLGEKASTYLNIADKMNQGKYFSKKDYYLNSNNEVPVVLGDLYSDMYNVGDSFEAIYLGTIKLKCNIIGFFRKDSSFYIDQKYNLDDKIVMPALNIEPVLSLKNKKFEQILYSIKNTGYIPYNNDDEYNHNTTIIDKTANETNINWSYIGKNKNPFKENPINLSIETAKFIKILSWIISLILMALVYKLEKQIYKITNFSQNKKERVLLQTKKSIIMALQIFILYIITCFIMSVCLKNNAIHYTLIRIQKQNVIFLLLGFIIIIYMLNLYIKKNIRTE
ncbi:hypothetical protein EXM36_12415 [Clostridium botulinum]|uniref:hypothetical protein n=1 Tax=Clostridium botulinum TaxID=1491 RepID=UPI000774AA18|nr:hypothetical protein [Clostridium botulinum]MCC5418145.1 hypothetical protein [Clostridium botulinum]NCI22264.1 hypothetical protein [Clostridium botulinum]NCI37206.1 hypothetical protein [Clostridium botulinum]NCI74082.1 hypothetical protein [Clostridium botulinum]NDI40544.1 hypothetical protein [Clostridium botulinum]